jgi:hypothetical protein
MARSRMSRGQSVSPAFANGRPVRGIWQRLVLMETRPRNRLCQSVRAPPSLPAYRKKARKAETMFAVETRGAFPGWRHSCREACLRAPPQESRRRTPPLLDRRWCKSALAPHPGDIPVELALVQKRDGRCTPPAKKPQPQSPDIDDPPSSGGRPAKPLPLLCDRQQLIHADAAVGVGAETSRDPLELA